MDESELSNSARPGIIEAMMLYDGEGFRAKQLYTRIDHTSMGRTFQSLADNDYLEKIVDTNVSKYKWSDEIKAELENRRHDKIGELMKNAKTKWRNAFQEPIEKYDLDKLIEDIPEALYINESNTGETKLYEQKDHRLNPETLEYLDEIGLINNQQEKTIMLDDIEIQMLTRHFNQLNN